MLEVVLHILAILGIIILAALGILTVLLLAVLFFPVSYRVRGSKDADHFMLTVKIWWLLGLLRASYSYPEPGYAVVKALFFRLFDTEPSVKEDKPDKKSRKSDSGKKKASGSLKRDEKADSSADTHEAESGSGGKGAESARKTSEEKEEAPSEKEAAAPEKGFLGKIEKIKYTIKGLCDKIREIWDNISYYMELLQEEDTKQLFAHALLRTGKILKNIRPRYVKAELTFGFGTPDNTGYVYGLYCIFMSALGSGVQVTPDFENRVLLGKCEVRGHLIVWVALVNGLRLVLDKKLKAFLSKMKKEKREIGSQNGGKNGRQGKS